MKLFKSKKQSATIAKVENEGIKNGVHASKSTKGMSRSIDILEDRWAEEEQWIDELREEEEEGIFERAFNSFQVVNTTCNDAIDSKRDEYKKSDEGGFDFLCSNLETACGIEQEEKSFTSTKKANVNVPRAQQSMGVFKIEKEDPEERSGVSFVAYKEKSGVYVCKVKEGSKFLEAGLEPGMRVISINGKTCPERVGEAMALLNAPQRKIEIIAEKEFKPFQFEQNQSLDFKQTKTALDNNTQETQESAHLVETKSVESSVHTESSEDSSRDSFSHRMEKDGKVAEMMDKLLGQHKDQRSKKDKYDILDKKEEDFSNNVSFIVGNVKQGAPLWMFME